MQKQYDNKNRGALYFNDYKKEGDNKPNYTGPFNLNGVEGRMSAWLRTNDQGAKYMSLQWQSKAEIEAKKAAYSGERRPIQKSEPAPFDDEIPGFGNEKAF